MKCRYLFLAIIFLVTLLVTPALAAPGDTTRVSIATDGTEGNSHSQFPSISADGRYIAFESSASNLVAGDTNGRSDIFVHDRTTGVTTRVSVAAGGGQANGYSSYPSISAAGRYVAFISSDSNLVAGDTNGWPDIFVHDRTSGATTRVSIASSGAQANGASYYPVISADGRCVAFYSVATNLAVGDTNGHGEIFVHDRMSGATTRVSVDSSGSQANSDSSYPSISADGRYVAFYSTASNLVAGDTNGWHDVFVHDRMSGATTRVSVSSSGAQGDSISYTSSISADGRYVAFLSFASNLVANDTNGGYDAFVHDRTSGVTTRVSVSSSGAQANNGPSAPSISADGRYVAFASAASNLVAGDTNGTPDIFVHDRITGATTRISVNFSGGPGVDTYYSSISANGHYVTFHSEASNLVTGDTNGMYDVFVYEVDYTPPSPTAVPGAGSDPASERSSLPNSGFAPGRITLLPSQTIFYADLGDLWLEIPKLGLKMSIVGVPKKNEAWDVSWLGSNAGWLAGSAYPSWAGNSVLTGHVWNADNSAGPFRDLNTLWWGDKVIVHLSGQQYIYEVRSLKEVAPTDVSAMMKHEELPWLTLVSCKGYDKETASYRYRVLVRAVLVEVK